MSRTATTYWVEAPGRGALREAPLRAVGAADVELRTLASGISPGSERLVGLGLVPPAEAEAMACQGMQGTFALPIAYGYCAVGEVTAGPHTGQRAFVMYPHQDRLVVPAEWLVWLPPDLPPARATLLPNLETARNAVWDAELAPGEACAVVGGGAVGALVSFVLAATTGVAPTLVDADPVRRARLAALPWRPHVLAPDQLADGAFPVVFHATGRPEGLQLALDALGFEGRVVELSWYGDRPVTLRLGGRFHRWRQRIQSSQVATIARSHRAAGRAARTRAVLELLADARLDALLDAPVPFVDLPAFFARLYAGDCQTPCPHVCYPPA
jgi:threonine dehydrogenase-like Zn-dependent dehydrogenase